MQQLTGKKIILGVSGSIAAYKAVLLTRLLVQAGAEVQVLLTPAATHFVTPLTFSTLSKRPVFTEVTSDEGWNNHVELGLWADALVVAPATANTLAKLANGICDNIIAAVYLSARCPVFVAPAMDVDMWHHPSTQANVQRLLAYGNHLIPVGEGELASGLHGAGRLAEPEHITTALAAYFDRQSDLKGQKILITAGPTYEAIDPVRFLGNRSSGKMGVALAEAICARGGEVVLVLGPSALRPQMPGLEVVRVESAQEMYTAALAAFPQCHTAILAAAVADYRPATAAAEKIKKKGDTLTLELVKNPDIAAALGQQKQPHQRLVGFALETHEGEAHAREKLRRKHLDFIVLNTLQDSGAGFAVDTNKVTIFGADNKVHYFELKSKQAVAQDIINTTLVSAT
ncbi:MAG: bifunctional phosphopantothenoylcysteine decarboxylase/phosphopantothenate--cysteine ligase CoaBC [Bacteroidetes bacterium]|nr:MAG: bifunctional phosphopantothenoylcysteine decarboxylase/phosphopantothenate--cysteine ligase CoaBC [Bacteroidota bacterium]